MRVACLTPPGNGAIAVVGVRGTGAWQTASALFRPSTSRTLPATPTVGATWFGRMGDGAGDEVILAVSGPDRIEVHCHGGTRIVSWLIEAFRRQGGEPCPWSDWIEDDRVTILTKARTTRVAAILLDQLAGAFATALETAIIALESQDCKPLESLARWTSVGRHLTEPWRVVIAGAPNVGKSSLVNALSGYHRCVVAPIPGTTRDVVATILALDGWLVEISDTAGLRESGEELELAGMERSRVAIDAADVILWVVDGSSTPIWPGSDIPRDKLLIVRNKCDLPPAWSANDEVAVSAETRTGIDALIDAILQRLVPEAPAAGSAIPYSIAWCVRIERAWELASRGEWIAASGVLKNEVSR